MRLLDCVTLRVGLELTPVAVNVSLQSRVEVVLVFAVVAFTVMVTAVFVPLPFAGETLHQLVGLAATLQATFEVS